MEQTIKDVLNALATWFLGTITPNGADAIRADLGDFVKDLLDTVVKVVFPIK